MATSARGITQSGIPAWCGRCSRSFTVYWTKTIAASFKLHEPDCIGCPTPTPMFEKTIIELKPMDTPIGAVFEMDYKYKK